MSDETQVAAPEETPIIKLARRMFDAYNEQGPNPWKTFDGRDVPRWDAVTEQVRGKWEAAAGVLDVECTNALELITALESKLRLPCVTCGTQAQPAP